MVSIGREAARNVMTCADVMAKRVTLITRGEGMCPTPPKGIGYNGDSQPDSGSCLTPCKRIVVNSDSQHF